MRVHPAATRILSELPRLRSSSAVAMASRCASPRRTGPHFAFVRMREQGLQNAVNPFPSLLANADHRIAVQNVHATIPPVGMQVRCLFAGIRLASIPTFRVTLFNEVPQLPSSDALELTDCSAHSVLAEMREHCTIFIEKRLHEAGLGFSRRRARFSREAFSG